MGGEEDRRTEEAFAALSRRACPPLGEVLFAVTATWRPVDWGTLDGQLDQLALPCSPPGRAATATLLAATFRHEARAVDGLWLDEVLAGHRGHPVLIAAVATSSGAARAGSHRLLEPDRVVRGPARGDVLWLIDPTGEASGAGAPKTVRRHCAHEIAFVVLTGLASASRAPTIRNRRAACASGSRCSRRPNIRARRCSARCGRRTSRASSARPPTAARG